ncbi:MAG: TIGR03618 family F420-dependent PPOX class oxidoreductase [Chloroflexota bacterium]
MAFTYEQVAGFLAEHHLAVVATVGASGRAQNTVVSAGPVDGRIAFVSRDQTAKVRNSRRTGRATVTVVNPANKRYVTVEGPTELHPWDAAREAACIALLGRAYAAAGRPTERWEDFPATMREEQRTVVLVTPERIYGSL